MKRAAPLTVAAFVGMIHAAAAQQGPAPSNSTAPSTPIDYAAARLQRRLPAVRTAGPIVVDGTFDEASWSDAPVASGFIQNE
ncbi:MAG TPA: hypothetical protein VFB85_12060, partial [Vicinamibacterales bacterium]|nr:hypothetical protein [Vicinamibacterales bacterium]